MSHSPPDLPLRGWTVLCLRPSREATSLRRCLQHLGVRLVCVGVWRTEILPQARTALHRALAQPACIFTSPNAVAAAAGMAALEDFSGEALAVGAGTASRLRQAGVRRVSWPVEAMRSEGVLALAPLDPPPPHVGLVSGEGGRGLFGPALRARGAEPVRADVYRRIPCPPAVGASRRISAIPSPRAAWVSSEEALRIACSQPLFAEALRRFPMLVSSERLAAVATELGCSVVSTATSARPEALGLALHEHAKRTAFR